VKSACPKGYITVIVYSLTCYYTLYLKLKRFNNDKVMGGLRASKTPIAMLAGVYTPDRASQAKQVEG